jgi:PAS domain S-box-containing protein
MFDPQEIVRVATEEVLRQMPTAVMIVEAPSGETMLLNRQTQQMSERYLGQSEVSGVEDLRDLHDSGVFELFRPDGRPYELEEWPLMRSIRDGEEVRDEDVIQVMADGTRLTIRCNSSPIYDEEGRIVAGVAVVHDITEQKRSEEALRESQRQIENMLESITDAFVALDREWRYTYINERALGRIQRARGEELTREDLLGKNIWEIFPEGVGSVYYEKYHEAMREHKTVEFEEYSPVTDWWIKAHVYPSENGLAIYYRDVTERKQAEEQLASQARLLENIHDAVIATDEHLAVTAWNKGAEQMYGWRADEVLGRDLWEAVPSDLSEEQRAEALRELSERGRFRIEALTYAKDGTPVYVEGITIALRGEQGEGEITGYINIRRDISERKWAEERVEEGREAERSRLARDLHDEPLQDLTDALVQVQQIRNLSEDPQQTLRLVRLIATLDRIGPQLRGAVYDLRLEGEQQRFFPELLESLVELHRGMAPQSDIALEVHDGVLSGSLGERGKQLLRILGEALTNVRRHSGASHVRVGVGITEGKLWAEVEDDGRGFDAAQQDSEEALSSSGGLGIRGMRERARALGGDLKIESDPETGTRVRFEMALTTEREEPEGEVRILLVEDHAAVREALAAAFEQEAGFEVVGQAASLSGAREMLRVEPVAGQMDVAVVDLGLPDGYGGNLIKELREASPHAQALVLSASQDRAEIARAVEAGAAGVLNKTAHLERVVEAVRRLRAGETLMPLEEVVELLRFAGTRREEEHEARRSAESLTPREREVLQALAEGLTSEGIAERLDISLRTERNHMASILSKLGVHSQLQALVFALRHGVVEIP